MSILLIYDIVLSTIEAFVLIYVIWRSYKMVMASGSVWVLFFLASMIGLLLSDLYYITYSFIDPVTRMPFAFDEIAEFSMLLLLAAGFESINGSKKKINIPILIFSVVYLAVHIAAWIAWSGEWIQDIVFGIPYIYLFYLLITGIIRTEAFSKREITAFLILSVITFIVAAGEILGEGYIFLISSRGVSVASIIMEFGLLYKVIKTLKEPSTKYRSLYVTVLFFLMTLLDIYITEGVVYIFNNLFLVISPAVMYLAVKKELSQSDIY
ncbi:MAG: hypothetical protein K6G69_01450 [Lachnospiraceae bacterium]|nr:hypothetical protein [Lachnospiraceae bacterium]